MALTITDAPTDELLSTADAKRHLRLYSSDFDDEITSLVQAARDDCERETGRTFRTAVERVYTACEWWYGEWKAPFPPLLAVGSIKYRDADNAEQTLNASNYHVVLSTDGFGKVVWAADASLPTVYDRPDAISVTFTTGYADAASVPPAALQAMKVKLSELWGAGTDNEIRAAVECYKRLSGKVDLTSYA